MKLIKTLSLDLSGIESDLSKVSFEFTNDYKQKHQLKQFIGGTYGWVNDIGETVTGATYYSVREAVANILLCGTVVYVYDKGKELKFMKTYLGHWKQSDIESEIIFLDNPTAGDEKEILVAQKSNGEIFCSYNSWEEVHEDFHSIVKV